MSYPTLRRALSHFIELGFLPRSDYEQNDSARQCQPSKNWRNGNSVMIFSADMHGSYIHHVFAVSVVESLIGQGQTAKNNQEKSGQDDRFHILRFTN